MTAALYLNSIHVSVNGKTNSMTPVNLFITECTDINSFCRIYPAAIFAALMDAMTAIHI